MSGDEWIVDGNYGGTMELRIEKSDTIIYFELSRIVCIISYFKRFITNINKVRPDMPNGCLENFYFKFMKYIWNFPKRSGKRNIERIKNKHVIVFKNRSECKKYISNLTNIKNN